MGQQTLETAACLTIALAGYSFEASPVRHRDDASVLAVPPTGCNARSRMGSHLRNSAKRQI
jgi:hypothetical protein